MLCLCKSERVKDGMGYAPRMLITKRLAEKMLAFVCFHALKALTDFACTLGC